MPFKPDVAGRPSGPPMLITTDPGSTENAPTVPFPSSGPCAAQSAVRGRGNVEIGASGRIRTDDGCTDGGKRSSAPMVKPERFALPALEV